MICIHYTTTFTFHEKEKGKSQWLACRNALICLSKLAESGTRAATLALEDAAKKRVEDAERRLSSRGKRKVDKESQRENEQALEKAKEAAKAAAGTYFAGFAFAFIRSICVAHMSRCFLLRRLALCWHTCRFC